MQPMERNVTTPSNRQLTVEQARVPDRQTEDACLSSGLQRPETSVRALRTNDTYLLTYLLTYGWSSGLKHIRHKTYRLTFW